MIGGESQADAAILPVYPAMFKIACLRGIENNTILLKIKQINILTVTCGDRCAVNVKGACLLTLTVSNHKYQSILLTLHLAPLKNDVPQLIIAKKMLQIYITTYIAS